MKKLVIFVGALLSCSTIAFADGPEKMMQDAQFICDQQQSGREAKVASPSRGETPDFYLNYNSNYNSEQKNVGTQNTYNSQAGYNSTYGGYSRSGERQDNTNTTSNSTGGQVPFICK